MFLSGTVSDIPMNVPITVVINPHLKYYLDMRRGHAQNLILTESHLRDELQSNGIPPSLRFLVSLVVCIVCGLRLRLLQLQNGQ